MYLTIPISPGELLDRITILNLKTERIAAQPARDNCARELAMLKGVWASSPLAGAPIQDALDELLLVNAALWAAEDTLRSLEQADDFGAVFIATARSVYRLNDRRATLKRDLNQRLGSTLLEEKSYRASNGNG